MEALADRSRREAALVAAVAEGMTQAIAEQGRAIALLDGSPLLEGVYERLAREPLEWTRVIGIQLRERCGPQESAQRLLLERLVHRVAMAEFHALRGAALNLTAVVANQVALLRRRPPDLALVALEPSADPYWAPGRQGPIGDDLPWIGVSLDYLSTLPRCFLAGSVPDHALLARFGSSGVVFPLA
jgi:hypothetical protein